ncbi:MAG: glycine-rich domain-containing protein, partial [Planctomycetaceae bacterium]
MTPTQARLWAGISAHPLDDPRAPLTFTARLARENGWSIARAVRVVEEYRRFVLLAVTVGEPMTPSEDVDQVWHLHLVYTRDYWNAFCDGVLGVPLHHGPTRGGGD